MQREDDRIFSRRELLRSGVQAASAAAMATAFRSAAGATARTASGAAAGPVAPATKFEPASIGSPPLKRIAAINSIYRLRSHAYHICGRFIHGYERDGFHHQPSLRVARIYNHQSPKEDLAPRHCEKYGIELCPSAARTLGGPQSLDVDAVLLIIEHGDYPINDFGQVLYPRFEFFEQIVEVFRMAGRSVPVFVDKQLSYDYQKAARMVEWSRELGFGLMAGSSLPVTWREPALEPPLDTPFTEGLVVFGFDRGTSDIYFFHALEVLQCMLERRRGGETGVRRVECLSGDAVWAAADRGRFSWSLLERAVKLCPSRNIGPVRDNVRNPQLILVDYLDGTRGAAINLIEQVSEFAFAGTVQGSTEPIAAHFYLPPPPGARFFDPLCFQIEQFFQTGKPLYPVERTLLTSTVLDLALRGHTRGMPVEDPALQIRYAPPASSGFFRS